MPPLPGCCGSSEASGEDGSSKSGSSSTKLTGVVPYEYERNILPADPTPSHYELDVTPNMEAFSFAGTVTITLKATAECSTIVFNADLMKFKSGTVSGGGLEAEVKFETKDFVLDERNQRVTLSLPEKKSVKGEFKLEIVYDGVIGDQMVGFYKSKYTNSKGEVAYMASTQFEAVDFRKAVPSWDEPQHKATCALTLRKIDSKLTSLFNTPVEKKTDNAEDNTYDVTFQKTPILSTYLYAWVIAELEYVEQVINRYHEKEKTTTVRVYTTPGKKEKGRFALDVACKVQPLYEKTFGRDVKIPKIDMVAIPEFAAGAMENDSLITYRESALLCDDNSSAKSREWVALVVAHELAHFYFGNLVTMKWWDNLWLNEAFATWVEYWAVDQIFPEWKVFTQFVNDESGLAFTLDALESSHPTQVPIKNAEEVDEVFDVISYKRGSTMLRQITEVVGVDNFFKGVRSYLEEFAFSNATGEDLYRHLAKASGKKDLPEALTVWIRKQGYPVLKVSSKDEKTLSVTQQRYLSKESTKGAAEADKTVWNIPLKVITGSESGEVKEELITFKDKTGEIKLADKTAWVKLNGNQAAFCRVLYTEDALLQKLTTPVAEKKLGAIDRFNIVTDLHGFAQSGVLPTATALKFVQSYEHEDDATVWCAVAGLEADVRKLVQSTSNDELKEAFDEWAVSLYSTVVDAVGFKPNAAKDDHRAANLRATVFSRACTVNHPAAVKAALEQWDALIDDGTQIPSDLRAIVYTTALRQRGDEVFAKLKEMHAVAQQGGSDASEAPRIVRILGLGKSEEMCQRAVEYALSDEVKAQDAFITLVALSGNPHGQAIFETTLFDKFDLLWKKFPGMIISRVVKAIENMADTKICDRTTKFLESLTEAQRGSIGRSANQGIEGLKVAAAWRDRSIKGIEEFLK